jgi:hypothetical protein
MRIHSFICVWPSRMPFRLGPESLKPGANSWLPGADPNKLGARTQLQRGNAGVRAAGFVPTSLGFFVLVILVTNPEISPGLYSYLFWERGKTGGFRPVFNLKPLNRFVVSETFQMETPVLVAVSIRPGSRACSLALYGCLLSRALALLCPASTSFHQWPCSPFWVDYISVAHP